MRMFFIFCPGKSREISGDYRKLRYLRPQIPRLYRAIIFPSPDRLVRRHPVRVAESCVRSCNSAPICGPGSPAFQVCNIADKECLHALPEATVSLIADLVEANPLQANPYMELQRHLLAAHQLMDIQREEQLFSLPPLTVQKPLKLLAEMLHFCPRGQENNTFFNCWLLSKLPRELRILLLEADMADKQALGTRVGLFTAHNSKHAHAMVAALTARSLQEQGEEPTVTAVHPGASSGQRGSGGRQ